MMIETKRRVAKGLQLGLVVGVLVGLSGLIQTAWLADPIPALAQTVTVDSTQSPIVVNAVADLADLTPTDGQSVIIKTGTEKGLWYYDKNSATATSVSVLNGPGSVGRFLVINNDAGSVAAATAITAAEITDDGLLELQAFDGSSAKSLTLEELKKTGVQVVNVKQYGATGDGVADDTTAYLAVLAACEGTTSVAYFPPGTYLLGSLAQYGFQVSDTLTIRGDKAIIKGDSQVSHYDAITLIDGAELDVEGITFDTFYIPIWGESTFLNGSLRVARCKFTACEIGIASATTSDPSSVEIVETEVYGYLHKGISWQGIASTDVKVIGNHIHTASGANIQTGIQIGDNGVTSSKSIVIQNNKINDHIRTATGTVIGIVSYGYEARIESNTLENVNADASGNSDAESGIYSKASAGSISNNTLINAGRGNGCIVWKGGFDSSVIANNTIVMTDSTYNAFVGIRAYVANCVVSGNVLQGDGASVNTGILLGDANEDRQSPKNVIICNNSIVNCIHEATTGRAITIPGGMDIVVKGNAIRNCGTSAVGALSYGIDVSQASDMRNISISDNEIDDPAVTTYSYAVRVDSNASGNAGLLINRNTINGYHCGIVINATTTTGYWSTVSLCGNYIDAKQAGGAGVRSIGIEAFNVQNGCVSGNTIANIDGDATTECGAIKLWSGIANGIDNVTVRDNVILNITSANQYYGYGINIYENGFTVSDVDVSDNTINIAKRGILFQSAAGSNLRMTGNNVAGIVGVNAGDDYTFAGPTTSIVRENYEDYVLHTVNGLVEASTAGSGAPNVLLQLESRKLLTNEGTTAANYHTLPTAVAGLTYTFAIPDTDGIRVTAATGDTIRLGANVTATAGYVESTSQGGYLTVTAINATEWVGLAYGTWTNGTWTYEVLDTP